MSNKVHRTSPGVRNRIIKTDEQHRKALEEVRRLAEMDPVADSAEGGRLELLAKLVDAYEKDRFAFNKPDPIDAITFRMQEIGEDGAAHAARS